MIMRNLFHLMTVMAVMAISAMMCQFVTSETAPPRLPTPTLTPTIALLQTGIDATAPPVETLPPEATPSPTVAEPTPPSPIAITVSCADIDTHWGRDWPMTVRVIEQLIQAEQGCGGDPLSSKLYAAHFNYAQSLEQAGEVAAAATQYQAALLLDPIRQEALRELTRLNALPAATPVTCQSTVAAGTDPARAETVDRAQLIRVAGSQLMLHEKPFKVKGVNYYPRQAAWHRFIEEADLAAVTAELDVIQQVGFNTVRIFLRYEPLFDCQPEDAIPNEAAFAKLDRLFELTRERNLKLIVTLNDLPDLAFRPLYTDWAHYDAQTVYIVRRYRHEPHILAWDLRNEGDLDYGVSGTHTVYATQAEVMAWLAHVSELVRQHDPHHLITAGWFGDPTDTAPYSDILSFHHWAEADALRARIATYQQQTDKPLLLQEVGYHSWAEAAHDRRSLVQQADILGRVVSVAEETDIAGWVVWTAFDFVPRSGQPKNHEHFFGLWTLDLTAKPALETLPLE